MCVVVVFVPFLGYETEFIQQALGRGPRRIVAMLEPVRVVQMNIGFFFSFFPFGQGLGPSRALVRVDL